MEERVNGEVSRTNRKAKQIGEKARRVEQARGSRGCSREDSKGIVIIAEIGGTASLAVDWRMRR